MQLTLNDHSIQLSAPVTLAALIRQHYPDNNGIAVAVNQQVVNKSLWEQTELQPEDRISLFTVVAGG
ncbi:sulfur carrier protein ThiS [Lacimicrobium alkaliphilum]|uniref:Thiamine biosynthesis protein ThiS n=1 Tax=Lacimicrobium alkaliphilum TaxID=1526571 RepID=A0ABQ1RCF0_9ALTE|nr:sulfur carrier protein ThiS [Lacimicrobium alkaliphilum]GGD65842.1 hypothetical protein GCM10011357_21340 [Lacimicrobium alkaliphilum]